MTPEELRRDRRRFHAHAAAFLIGGAGWLGVFVFHAAIMKTVIPWLLLGFSLVLTASGALAIAVGRTFLSGPAHDDELGDAPHGDLGDALATPGLHTFDLLPEYKRLVAPYALFGASLALSALSGYWAFCGLP